MIRLRQLGLPFNEAVHADLGVADPHYLLVSIYRDLSNPSRRGCHDIRLTALATCSERFELPSLKPMNPDLVPGTKP